MEKKINKQLIAESFYLDPEYHKQMSQVESEESPTPHKELIGCVSHPPAPPPSFLLTVAMLSREQRGYKKSDLVRTIIMLVALVRHTRRYLNSSSVSSGSVPLYVHKDKGCLEMLHLELSLICLRTLHLTSSFDLEEMASKMFRLIYVEIYTPKALKASHDLVLL